MTLISLLSDSLFPLLAVFSVSLAECACVPRCCVHHVSASAPHACVPQRCVHIRCVCAAVPRASHACLSTACVCVCASALCARHVRACLGAACVACVTCVPQRHMRHVRACLRVHHVRASAPCASRACVPRCRVRHVPASAPRVRYICRCLGAACVACVRALVLRACVSASAPGTSRACIPRG